MAKRLYKLGSLAQDTAQGLITIFKTGLVNRYNTLESVKDTDYQVPPAKKFYITHVLINATAVGTLVQILYGDTVVSDSVVPPSNAVYISPAYISKEANANYSYDVFFEVPAGKYLAIGILVGGAMVEVQGLEI